MATARVMQPVLSGGEIGPEFRGRTDTVKYQTALAKALNLTLKAGGGAENRAGLEFLNFAEDEDHPVVFIEFEGEDASDTYMLEFGHFSMRIWQDGALILFPAGHPDDGEIVVIVTPFSAAKLPDLEYDQSNDVVTIVDGVDDVYELHRLDHHLWTFTAQSFAAPTNVPTSVAVVGTTGYADSTSTDPYLTNHVYAVTAVLKDGRETILSATANVDNRLGWPQNFNTVTWIKPAGVEVEKYGVYKQRNTLWGLLGYTTLLTFKDDNIAPDWSFGPPGTREPFAGVDDKPRTVAYFQQRRLFGGTANDRSILEGTRSSQLSNMARSEPTRDDDSLTIPMSGPRRQSIVALIALDDLLVFTKSGEWYMTGDDEVITPSSFPRPATNYGSEAIKPLVAGNRILMVERLGKIVRDIAFSFEAQGYQSPENRSIFVEHYFRNRKIIGWCFQSEKGLVWLYCDDGAFFTFTYLPEHDVWGWSMQATRGRIEAMRAVREANETMVYASVRRRLGGTWRRTVERLHTRLFTTIKDAFFVDCGISYDNPIAVEAITVAADIRLTITAHGIAAGRPLDVELTGLVGEDFETYLAGDYWADVIDANTIRLADVDGDPISAAGWTVYDNGGVVREKVTELTGWQHLANMPIVLLCDGAVVNGITVSSTGGITLPSPAGRVHGGLDYTAEWQTLELKRGTETTEGLIQSVDEITLRVDRTRGLKIGSSWDSLYDPASREGMDYGPEQLSDKDITISASAEWNELGRVHVRQSDPLPATILAFIPTITYDKG